MAIFRGELYETKDPEADYRRHVFICGVQGEWVWYIYVMDKYRIGESQPWIRGRVNEFERKFTFTNHVVATRAYWKKKATGEMTQVVGLKDDGWNKIFVYYDLNKIHIQYFLEYFEPATKEEVLENIAREGAAKKNTKRIKRRIAMEKGDPAAPITYEEEPPCQDK